MRIALKQDVEGNLLLPRIDRQSAHFLQAHAIVASAPLSLAEIANYRALGVTAFINVPLLRNSDYRAGITVHDSRPHLWTPDEIDLIREVARRVPGPPWSRPARRPRCG